MSGAGFYKRRRGILEHLEAGKISLLDSGIHDYLSLKMNGLLGSGSSIPPGVVFTSSRAICSQCPLGASEREVRRSLKRLEHLGWIKRWRTPGKHGNYPVLVARGSVHNPAGNEYRINAAETMDWREPVLILAATCPRDDREVSTDREVRTETREKPKAKAAKTAPPADPRFQPFFGHAYDAFRTRHGTNPNWSGKHRKCLRDLLKRNGEITSEELIHRWDNFLTSTDAFIRKQAGSLAYFCSAIDSFKDGPQLEQVRGGKKGYDPIASDERLVRAVCSTQGIHRSAGGVAPRLLTALSSRTP